jgi:thiol-disulfide isomerase/thioredoxin
MRPSHFVLGTALGMAVACTRSDTFETRPRASNQEGIMPEKAIPKTGASTFPSLAGATAWLNSAPLTVDALRGKVVVVDFWTYSCINWRRSLPYVRAWAEKYRDRGLVVIGVHTPEFEFEKSIDNVQKAVLDMRIDYPVAVDSDYSIWNAFENHYWPALYFIDSGGHVRHQQFGEGSYDRSERVIQDLLIEAGSQGVARNQVSPDARGPELDADWENLGSPETYVGRARGVNFASPGGAVPNRPEVYAYPAGLRLNQWALAGDWTIAREAAVLNAPKGRISYRFHARDVHLVMGPATRGRPVRFRVYLDGKPPAQAHGVDVDDRGNGTIAEPRMYQLIRQAAPIHDRVFEIEFLDPGAEVFSFTFG